MESVTCWNDDDYANLLPSILTFVPPPGTNGFISDGLTNVPAASGLDFEGTPIVGIWGFSVPISMLSLLFP